MIIETLASRVTHSGVSALVGLLSLLALTGFTSRSLGLVAVGLCPLADDRSVAVPPGKRAAFVISGLHALTTNDVWVVAFEGEAIDSRLGRSVILHTSDGGTTWKRQLITEAQTADAKNRRFIEDVNFVSRMVGWAAGYTGTILKTTDGGESWHGQLSPTDAILIRIQFVDDDWGWILAEEGGEILHTRDGGRTWVTYHFPATGRVSSLSFRDKFNGWIVGEMGQAFQTTDSGRTWQPRGAEMAAKVSGWRLRDVNFPEVRFSSGHVGFIAAGINYRYPRYKPNGVIFKTTDGGLTWRPNTATENLGLKYVDFVSEEEAWVVLYDYRDDRLLHTIDGGKNWAFVRAKSKAGIVRFVNPKNGWLIAGQWDYPATDRLLRTVDGGQTWSEVSLPKWTDDK